MSGYEELVDRNIRLESMLTGFLIGSKKRPKMSSIFRVANVVLPGRRWCQPYTDDSYWLSQLPDLETDLFREPWKRGEGTRFGIHGVERCVQITEEACRWALSRM
jgi:hypothetical protein